MSDDRCMTGCGRLALWCGDCADCDGDRLRAVAEAARAHNDAWFAYLDDGGEAEWAAVKESAGFLRDALAKLDGAG